jgi:NADH:ubiquinone oxidoreductase subunit 3 (subunit A)
MINEVLGTDFELTSDNEVIDREIQAYRTIFMRRKNIRIATFYSAIIFLVIVGFVLIFSPRSELFGIPKQTWTPFVYIIMFIHLITLGIYWRCPSCNRLLGDVFNIRRCSHCGLKFYD